MNGQLGLTFFEVNFVYFFFIDSFFFLCLIFFFLIVEYGHQEAAQHQGKDPRAFCILTKRFFLSFLLPPSSFFSSSPSHLSPPPLSGFVKNEEGNLVGVETVEGCSFLSCVSLFSFQILIFFFFISKMDKKTGCLYPCRALLGRNP